MTSFVRRPRAPALVAVGLAGTLAALAVRFIRRDVLGAENAAAKQYANLRDAAWESRTLLARL